MNSRASSGLAEPGSGVDYCARIAQAVERDPATVRAHVTRDPATVRAHVTRDPSRPVRCDFGRLRIGVIGSFGIGAAGECTV